MKKKIQLALVIIADIIMLFFGLDLLNVSDSRLNTIGLIITIILIILNYITFKPLLKK